MPAADPGPRPRSDTRSDTLHATTVAHAGHAVLLRGAAGSGKSGLALQMIALGAALVADDRTIVTRDGDHLTADAPGPIRNRIEARGLGILNSPATGPAHVALLVDMDSEETERLPPIREIDLLGLTLPLLRKVNAPHFPAALMVYLEHGRNA